MSTGDISYAVIADFQAKTEQFKREVKTMETMSNATAKAISGVKRAALGIGAAVGVGLGVHALWGKLIGENAEDEMRAVRMAGALRMKAGMDEAAAKARALHQSEAYEKLSMKIGVNEDAIAAAGIRLDPIFAKRNMSEARSLELTRATVALATMAGQEYGEMGSQITMMLGSHAVVRERSAAWRALASGTKMSATEFQKMSEPKRFEFVTKQLQKQLSLEGEQVNTWTRLKGRIDATVSSFFKQAGAPLFEKVKEALGDIATRMTDPKFAEWRKSISEGLVSAFETVKTLTGAIANNFGLILDSAKAIAAVWAASKLWGVVSGAAGMAGSGGGLMGGIKEAFALRAAGAATTGEIFSMFGSNILAAATQIGLLAVAAASAYAVLKMFDVAGEAGRAAGVANNQRMIADKFRAEQEAMRSVYKDVKGALDAKGSTGAQRAADFAAFAELMLVDKVASGQVSQRTLDRWRKTHGVEEEQGKAARNTTNIGTLNYNLEFKHEQDPERLAVDLASHLVRNIDRRRAARGVPHRSA